MGLADKITEKIKSLSEDKQVEVLDFVDFLQKKNEEEEKAAWSKLSLNSAMRGIEDEGSTYSVKDLEETFS